MSDESFFKFDLQPYFEGTIFSASDSTLRFNFDTIWYFLSLFSTSFQSTVNTHFCKGRFFGSFLRYVFLLCSTNQVQLFVTFKIIFHLLRQNTMVDVFLNSIFKHSFEGPTFLLDNTVWYSFDTNIWHFFNLIFYQLLKYGGYTFL